MTLLIIEHSTFGKNPKVTYKHHKIMFCSLGGSWGATLTEARGNVGDHLERKSHQKKVISFAGSRI